MKLLCTWLATALAFSTLIIPSIAAPTPVLSNTQYSSHPWKKQADWMKPHRKHKKERNAEGQTAAQQNGQQNEAVAGNQPVNNVSVEASAQSTDKGTLQTESAGTKQISDTNSQVSK